MLVPSRGDGDLHLKPPPDRLGFDFLPARLAGQQDMAYWFAQNLLLFIREGADVPDSLKQVELWGLDLGALQSGASVKGEFEKRLKSVIDQVKNSATPIVLFIDEAHTLIGAGGQAGGRAVPIRGGGVGGQRELVPMCVGVLMGMGVADPGSHPAPAGADRFGHGCREVDVHVGVAM